MKNFTHDKPLWFTLREYWDSKTRLYSHYAVYRARSRTSWYCQYCGFLGFFFTVIYVRFPITKKCLHTQLPTKALSWKSWSMWIKMTRRPLGIIIGRGTFSCVTYLYECSLLYNITIFVCESIYWLTTFIIWECVLLHFLDMHSSVFLVYDYKKKNGYLIVLEITYERNENLYCIDNICNDNIRQWSLKEIIKR